MTFTCSQISRLEAIATFLEGSSHTVQEALGRHLIESDLIEGATVWACMVSRIQLLFHCCGACKARRKLWWLGVWLWKECRGWFVWQQRPHLLGLRCCIYWPCLPITFSYLRHHLSPARCKERRSRPTEIQALKSISRLEVLVLA